LPWAKSTGESHLSRDKRARFLLLGLFYRGESIETYTDLASIILVLADIIVTISMLTDKSPLVLLSGLSRSRPRPDRPVALRTLGRSPWWRRGAI